MKKRSGLEREAHLEDTPRLTVENENGLDPQSLARLEIAEAAHPTAGFFLMNLFASVVASYGLLANSTAVVIGAMVIAVLLGPIAGVGLAIVISDRKLFTRAFIAVLLGSLEVLIVSYIVGSVHELPAVSNELLSRTEPNLFDLMIALAGGGAGAYAVARRVPGGTMIGVAIATALVPPLCTVGITASYGQWELSSGALLLFFSNFVAIQVAYSIVLFALRFRPHEDYKKSPKRLVTNALPSLIIFIGLALFLGSQLQERLEQRKARVTINDVLKHSLAVVPGAHLSDVQFSYADTLAIVATINSPEPIQPTLVRALEQDLLIALAKPLQLSVRSISMKVANRDTFLFLEEELEEIERKPVATTSPITPDQLDSILFGDSVRVADSIAIADSIAVADSIAAAEQARPKRRRR